MRGLVGTVSLLVVALVVLLSLYLFLSNMPSSEDCTPFQQLTLLQAFKGDVLVFVLAGALLGAGLYLLMLRFQVFFPRLDLWRMALAIGVSGLLVLAFVAIDLFVFGSECLRVALGPESAVPEMVPAVRSLFGHLVANAYLAIVLDFLLCSTVLLLAVRGVRQVLWSRA